jgi:hypothetical protein
LSEEVLFWPSGDFQGTLVLRAATRCHPDRAARFKTHDLDQGDRLLAGKNGACHLFKTAFGLIDVAWVVGVLLCII